MSPPPLVAAALWMSGAIVAFTLMAVAGREAGLTLDTFEIMLWRSLIGLVLVAGYGLATGRLAAVRTARPGLHLVRNLCHFTGQNLWFAALTLIPLAQVFALEFTTPVWVALLAALVLGERLTGRRLAVVALGFAGILVITRPGFEAVGLGQVLAAASAVFFAGSIVTTKLLGRGDGTWTIMFWMTVMQSAMGLAAAGFDGDIALPSAAALPWVVLIGLTGLGAHLCITSALRHAPAGVVSPMDFLRLPVIAAVGILVYDEALEGAVIAGAALVLAGNLLNLAPTGRKAAA